MKRAILSLKQTRKSILLFFLIFGLSTFILGALRLYVALNQIDTTVVATENHVFTTVEHDMQASDVYIAAYGIVAYRQALQGAYLTTEIVEEIGNLEQVRRFEYARREIFYSQTFRRPDIPWFPDADGAINYEGFTGFTVVALNTNRPIQIEADALELTSGRGYFREDETNALMMSEVFARANGVSVGDRVTFSLIWYESPEVTEISSFEMEMDVVGIFRPNQHFIHSEDAQFDYRQLSNMFFVSHRVFDETTTQTPFELPPITYAIFELYDPLEMEGFTQIANELLPQFSHMLSFQSALNQQLEVLVEITPLLQMTLIGLMVAMTLSVGFLLVFYLYDRLHEIGIYISLGKRKIEIFFQFFTEISLITFATFPFALMLSNQVVDRFAHRFFGEDTGISIRRSAAFHGTTSNNLGRLGLGFTDEFVDMFAEFNLNMTLIQGVGYTILIYLAVVLCLLPGFFYLYKKGIDQLY